MLLLRPLVRRAKNQGKLEVDSILATFGLLFSVSALMLRVFGGAYHLFLSGRAVRDFRRAITGSIASSPYCAAAPVLPASISFCYKNRVRDRGARGRR